MNAETAVLASWAFLPMPAFVLMAAAFFICAAGGNFVGRFRPDIPSRGWMFFLAGLAAIYLSLASPLDAFASFMLSAHMVQHMLLTMVVPPLLLLGAPQLPLLCGLPRRITREVLGPFLQWPLLKHVVHRLMHPAVCWILFILSNVLWHLPSFYELALRSPAWHKFEHFCFLDDGPALLVACRPALAEPSLLASLGNDSLPALGRSSKYSAGRLSFFLRSRSLSDLPERSAIWH